MKKLNTDKSGAHNVSGLIMLMVWFILPAMAQDPTIVWQNTINGNGQDDHRTFAVANDGGYLIGALSSSGVGYDKTEPSRGSYDFWLIKTDMLGNVVWDKTLGGTSYDNVSAFINTPDGGYLVAGWSESGANGDKTEGKKGLSDYWVLKLDAARNIVWQNTIGSNATDDLYAADVTADGGYILAGYSNSNASADKSENSIGSFDYWVVKLNASGNIVWENTIGGSGEDRCYAMTKCLDGGYLLGGFSYSGVSGDKTAINYGSSDFWIVKIDDAGNVIWDRSYGGDGFEGLGSMIETPDGGFVLAGNSESGVSGVKTVPNYGEEDNWIIKTDDLGNIIWQNGFGGNADDVIPVAGLYETPEHDYIVAGYTASGNNGTKTEVAFGSYDMYTVKINNNGRMSWENAVGGDFNDLSESAGPASDGGYILCGWSATGVNGDKTEASIGNDIWIMKLEDCPAATPLVSDALGFCRGETIEVTAANEPGTYWQYDWFLNGSPIAPWMGHTITPWKGGTYEAFTIVPNSCSGYSGELFIERYPEPDKTIFAEATPDLCFNYPLKLKVLTQGEEFTYVWYKDELPVPAATERKYYVTEPGTYKALVTSNFGCGEAFSNEIIVINSCRAGEERVLEQIHVYPNPATDLVQVSVAGLTETGLLTIRSVNGQTLFTRAWDPIEEELITWDATTAAPGLYIVELVLPDRTITQKCLIAR